MKIVKTIKISKTNIEEILFLECVDRLGWSEDGTLEVHLNPGLTKGRLTVREGEYLCQFASGLWQRFGSEAFGKTVCKPRKEEEW